MQQILHVAVNNVGKPKRVTTYQDTLNEWLAAKRLSSGSFLYLHRYAENIYFKTPTAVTGIQPNDVPWSQHHRGVYRDLAQCSITANTKFCRGTSLPTELCARLQKLLESRDGKKLIWFS